MPQTSCRKISGGPYQIFAHVDSTDLTLYDNESFFRYEGLPKADIGGIRQTLQDRRKSLLSDLRSSLAMRYKHQPDKIGLTMGSIDEDSIKEERMRTALRPEMHIFVSQKAWFDAAHDDLPKYERFSGSFEQDLKLAEGKEG